MEVYAGIDWSREFHALCLLDCQGKVVFEACFDHSRSGLTKLIEKLKEFGKPQEMKVAIELTRGPVVELLSQQGFEVMPVHPNHLANARGCFGAAGSKSDRKDAMVLADVLRTSSHRLRKVAANPEKTRIIKRLVARRQAVMQAHHRACQQLGHVLAEVFPAAVDLFSSLECGISLTFLKQYPTAEAAAGLTERRLESFLKRNAYPGQTTAASFLERLEAGAPAVAITDADAFVVREMVSEIRAIQASLDRVEAEIERAVEVHPDRTIYASLPRVQTIMVASFIASIGNADRYPTAEALAADGGVVPVVEQSGKLRHTKFRNACNKDLRHTLTILANLSRQKDPWAASIYKAARSRGCRHPHALRILARAWTSVLFRMIKDRTTYDSSRHKRRVA